jgi:hypothetical protein
MRGGFLPDPVKTSPRVIKFASSSSKKHSRIETQTARVVGARMQIPARRGDVAVSECLLDPGQCGAALNGMRTMGVPQPVRRDISVDAGCLRCLLYHAMHGTHALAFLTYEYGIIGAGVAAQR